MYKPKESNRWCPRLTFPLTLKVLSLNAATELLSKTASKMTTIRNSREKKMIRDYLHENLPVTIQHEIISTMIGKLAGAHVILNLLDLFDPKHMAKERVDLLGPFRMGFGCYIKDGRLTWSQGSAKKFNLLLPQLDQLYNILMWSYPQLITDFHISIARDVLKHSKLPNLLAKGKSLTNVTILSGAENHTMRILGMSCPSLKYLDVSHSIKVTDYGIRQFLLKRPLRRNLRGVGGPGSMLDLMTPGTHREFGGPINLERNPCAESIISITVLGTSVTWDGCDYACSLLSNAYLYSSLPIIKIVRLTPQGQYDEGILFNRRTLHLLYPNRIEEEKRVVLTAAVDNALGPDDLLHPVIDYFSLPKQNPFDPDKSSVFVRKMFSFKLNVHMKMEGNQITSLVLPWYTFTWKLESLINLDTLGLSFPNLKSLRGRVRGIWNRFGDPLLPQLQVACIWSLNSTTAISILQHAPSIRVLEFNNTQTLNLPDQTSGLSDLTLLQCISSNKELASVIEELVIRPTNLTITSLHTLIKYCPNLKRIGDLESWRINQEEIAEFNKYLDACKSQCLLSVMNFPPTSTERIEWV